MNGLLGQNAVNHVAVEYKQGQEIVRNYTMEVKFVMETHLRSEHVN